MASEEKRKFWGSQGSPVAAANVEAGTYTHTFGGDTTGELAYNADAATVQAALEGLASIGAGNILVTDETDGQTFEFQGALADTDVGAMTFTEGSTPLKQRADTVTVNTTTAGVAPTAEVQSVSLGGATTGTFRLDWGASGAEVSTLDLSGVQAAYDAVFGGGTVTVSGSDPFTATWNTVASPDDPSVSSNATDGSPSASTSTQGTSGTQDVTEVWLPDSPTQGEITLNNSSAAATSSWAYNADAATVEAAVEAISGGYPCSVTGAGTTADPWIITSDSGVASPGWTGSETVTLDLRKAVSAEIVTIVEGSEEEAPPESSAPTNRHATLIGG